MSPGTSRAVVERCQEHGVLALPGAVTATEVQAALELGLTTVKFFPAGTSGGAKAVAALAAPFGDVGFVPTGGIGPEQPRRVPGAALRRAPSAARGWFRATSSVAATSTPSADLTAEAVGLVAHP